MNIANCLTKFYYHYCYVFIMLFSDIFFCLSLCENAIYAKCMAEIEAICLSVCYMSVFYYKLPILAMEMYLFLSK